MSCFAVDGATGRREGGHVRDGVMDDEPRGVARHVDRLVQVHRPFRIDGHKRDIGQIVALAIGHRVGRLLRRP